MSTRKNPVRAQFLEQNGLLKSAGIRTVEGPSGPETKTITEQGAIVNTADPANITWLTQRMVMGALRKLNVAELTAVVGKGNGLSVNTLTITPALVAALKTVVAVARRTTEDHIVHMCGGETPENRAFAQAQVAALVEFYTVGSVAQAA